MQNDPKKPLILIDARMVSRRQHGISRFVEGFAKGLAEKRFRNELNYEPVFLLSEKEKLAEEEPWCNLAVVESDVSFLSVRELFALPKIIRDLKVSAYHSPSFSSLTRLSIPYLQTIHDLNHLTYGSHAQKIYYQFVLKRFAKHAKEISSVSKAAALEVACFLKKPPFEVSIFYNSFDRPDVSQETRANDLKTLTELGYSPHGYFLCIANEKPHKNVSFLKDIHQSLPEPKFPLVITHEKKFTQNQVNALFRFAGAVISPSLYEGFGRVPVEALLYGVRAIASQIEPHQEIAESLSDPALRLISLESPSDWRDAMIQVQQNQHPLPREETIDLILKKWSVNSLTEAVDQAYRRVLASSTS